MSDDVHHRNRRGIANSAVRQTAEGKPIAVYDFDRRAASAVYTSAHELVR